MINQLTVVIMAYNRASSLKRLLDSILQTNLVDYKVNFIFSLEKNATIEVIKVINDFEYNGIDKVVIKNDTKMGADIHNLMVQQLALIHENILILEDDHYVSPYIFDFSLSALNFYQDTEGIAAISLYPYAWVESASVPFIPLEDGFCNYFQQRPSSRGYLISKKQVGRFNDWKEINSSTQNQLPPNTKKWNTNNWEKKWYNYLIETNQFLVFPRVAYNTVFGDPGYNVKNLDERCAFQHSLSFGKSRYNFSTQNNSSSVYDSFYEYLLFSISEMEDVESDLYGTKNVNLLNKNFILTNSFQKSAVKSFGRDLKPIELNILLNNVGNEISIIALKHYKTNNSNNIEKYLYFNNLLSLPAVSIFLKFYFRKIKNKINGIIG